MPRFDVMLFGSACCDLVFSGLPGLPGMGEEAWATGLDLTAGGIVNAAVAMARLDLKVGLAAEAGTDEWSARVLEVLRTERVMLDHVRQYPHPYPQLTVVLNQPGDRTFISYADRRHAESFLGSLPRIAAEADASYFHVTALPEYAGVVAEARKRGKTVSLDAVWDEAWLKSAELRALIRQADIFMPNLKEAQTITGEEEPEAALSRLAEWTPTAVVKLGERGAIAAADGLTIRRSLAAAKPVDSTGAGDCFAAGFLYGRLAGQGLAECLDLGNRCGRRSVGRIGGYAGAPTLQQLLEERDRESRTHGA
ncbi:carbohydrate kinase family protein [Cohnella nanjingensis]|uniref:Carbohydrate kinase family protein n=1 Tax=Cohnella nanjingensis TaxID=1387779 RepID=A0A7X0VHM3_9BACL|nr:carbohydrate kinase family protein [Cohnella nanjingensis]MBB6674051.1 carbohydrate kinase family protein [Cohnella nanjingensis]